MSLKLNGATSGSIELDVPAAIGSDLNVTLPATAGEIVVANTSGDVDLGGLTVSGSAADDSVNIDSSGRLLVGTTSASGDLSLLLQTDSGGNNFGILGLAQNTATPADNSVLGDIRFSDSGHSLAAMVRCRRDGGTWSASSKPTRLEFYTTADGASSVTERMRITSSGRFFTDGITQYFSRGYTSGNQSFQLDYSLGNENSALIVAGFNHFGLFSYGCTLVSFAATGSSFSTQNVHNQTSAQGGSWSITKPDNSTLRVTKTAGNYNGGGNWFIHVVSS